MSSTDGIVASKSFLLSKWAMSAQTQAEFGFARDKLIHPHVVRIVGFNAQEACMSMEFVDGGSLEDLLCVQGPLQAWMVVKFTQHIVHGLAFLHEHGLVHRDMKPSNVLIDARTQVAKVADWIGIEQENYSLLLGKPVGTPLFMAPEVAGLPHKHTVVSDTWAVGCTVLNMLTGRMPWENEDNAGRTNEFMAMWKTAHGHQPPYDSSAWSPHLCSFVALCLDANKDRRPRAEALCKHLLFTGAERSEH